MKTTVKYLIEELEKVTGSREMADEVLDIVWRWQSYRLIEEQILQPRRFSAKKLG